MAFFDFLKSSSTKKLEAQLATAQASVASLTSQLAAANAARSVAVAQLATAQTDKTALQAALQAALDAAKTQVAELNTDLAIAQDQLAKSAAALTQAQARIAVLEGELTPDFPPPDEPPPVVVDPPPVVTPSPVHPTTYLTVDSVILRQSEASPDFGIVVKRTGAMDGQVSAKWTVSADGANPASASDFQGGMWPSGTVTIDAGETQETIHVLINPDTTKELDEGFKLTLSNPSTGVEISNAVARAVILNDDGAVVVPPPVEVPPPVVTPPTDGSFGPIVGKALAFSEDFSKGYKDAWQTWFPFGGEGTGKDISSRCYFNGSQPCVFTDPDYDPQGPVTIQLLPGGGLQLNTAKNPRPTDPKVAQAYVGAVILTKSFQCKLNSYVEYDMTVSDKRGSFSSGWSWQFPECEEVDTFEQLGVNPRRLFWGAIQPSTGKGANPSPAWAEGAITNLRNTFGTLWTPAGVEWFVNRKSVGFAAIKLTLPRNLLANVTVGGWDGNSDQIADNTSIIVHSVKCWQA